MGENTRRRETIITNIHEYNGNMISHRKGIKYYPVSRKQYNE